MASRSFAEASHLLVDATEQNLLAIHSQQPLTLPEGVTARHINGAEPALALAPADPRPGFAAAPGSAGSILSGLSESLGPVAVLVLKATLPTVIEALLKALHDRGLLADDFDVKTEAGPSS